MTVVEARPGDPLPWVLGCERCRDLSEADEPGLLVWIQAVGAHFLLAHDITLRHPR